MPKSLDYAFTITLKPFMRKFSNCKQHQITAHWIKCVLKADPEVVDVTMVAELTQSCDVHYHGIINFKEGTGYPVNHWYHIWRTVNEPALDKRKLMEPTKHHIGYTNIKPVDDFEGWAEYLVKDMNNYEEIVKCYPIISDDHEIFDTIDILTEYDREEPLVIPCDLKQNII